MEYWDVWIAWTPGRHRPAAPEAISGTSALTRLLTLQQRTTPAIVNSFARSYAADAKASPTEVTSILEQRIRGVQEEAGLAETGRVLSVGYEMERTMRKVDIRS